MFEWMTNVNGPRARVQNAEKVILSEVRLAVLARHLRAIPAEAKFFHFLIRHPAAQNRAAQRQRHDLMVKDQQLFRSTSPSQP